MCGRYVPLREPGALAYFIHWPHHSSEPVTDSLCLADEKPHQGSHEVGGRWLWAKLEYVALSSIYTHILWTWLQFQKMLENVATLQKKRMCSYGYLASLCHA